MTSPQPQSIPFAAQAVPFADLLVSGKIPEGLLNSEYVAQQFVERLVHYVLSVPSGSYTMAQLSQLCWNNWTPVPKYFSSSGSKKRVPKASRILPRSITDL